MIGIANHRTGSRNPSKERCKTISVTVPDRTLSLRQLIERYQTGGQVKSFQPIYLGDTSMIPQNFERLDMTERAALLKELPLFISAGRGRLQTYRRALELEQKRAQVAPPPPTEVKEEVPQS